MMYVMNEDIEPNFNSFMFPCDYSIFGQVLRQIFTLLIRTCRSAFTVMRRLCDLLRSHKKQN
jgi:hypothetical protein